MDWSELANPLKAGPLWDTAAAVHGEGSIVAVSATRGDSHFWGK